MIFSFRPLLLPVALCFFVSCTTSKKVPYMQDAGNFTPQRIPGPYAIDIDNDDQLSIIVSSKDTVLAQPFNRVPGGAGYLVDANGNIDFPVFGKMRVAGETPARLADSIKNKLISR